MPYLVAHGIVGTGIVALSLPNVSLTRDWEKLALGAFLAICPDFDVIFLWFLHLPWHRGYSHSIAFAVVVPLLMALLRIAPKVKEAAVYGLAIASHGLIDVVTTKTATGVKLLWPLSTYTFKLGLFEYPEFYVDLRYQSFAVALINLLKTSLIELVVFAPILLSVLLLRRRMTFVKQEGATQPLVPPDAK